jgi:mannitol-1-phosphate/altronate dehydrogenase
MRDQLTRLTRRGASKVSHHLVPSIRQAVEDGRPRALLVLAVAGWVVLEADEQGTEPEVVLSDANALGPLTGDAAFEDELRRAVKAVRERGARDAIKDSLTPLEGAA